MNLVFRYREEQLDVVELGLCGKRRPYLEWEADRTLPVICERACRKTGAPMLYRFGQKLGPLFCASGRDIDIVQNFVLP